MLKEFLLHSITYCLSILVYFLFFVFIVTTVEVENYLGMDVFEYRSSRTVNKNGVFKAKGELEGDLGGLFMRLKNLMISEIHTQRDIAFLEQHVTDSMVPRSLRWDVSPQRDELELEDWFKYFNTAGVAFLEFLIKRKNNKLAHLDVEIKLIKEKLSPHVTSEEYKERSSNLKKLLEKEEVEQNNKKRKKYYRDVGDYKNGLVFDWQKILASEAEPTTHPEVPPPAPGRVLLDPAKDGANSPHIPGPSQHHHPTNIRRVSYRSPEMYYKPPTSKPRTPGPQRKDPWKSPKRGLKNNNRKSSYYTQQKGGYHPGGPSRGP